MLVFDIGANIGKWSLANIGRYDRIVSVEASPITFEKLKKQCAHNRIILLNYAVCNNNGQPVTFYHANADTISTLNRDWLLNPRSRFYNYPHIEIQCPSITLDTLISQYGIPDLIKIDVEDAEYECIRSLSQKVPTLCFEWASESGDMAIQCIDYCADVLGFDRFYIQMEDSYTFVPEESAYSSIENVKNTIRNSVPKKDWGMVWCK